jgi:hypothetical protein
MSRNWVSRTCRDHVVALEPAWNTPHNTTEGYRQVGRELGQAIERYFRQNPRLAEAGLRRFFRIVPEIGETTVVAAFEYGGAP